MNKKKIGIAVITLLLVMGGIYGYTEYNRKNPDLADLKPAEKISASVLVQAFKANDKEAAVKYIDKVVAVSGTIMEIINDDGYYTIAVGDAAGMDAVRGSIDSIHNKEAAALTKGTAVVLKGVCTGFNADELLGSDVVLNRCVIETK